MTTHDLIAAIVEPQRSEFVAQAVARSTAYYAELVKRLAADGYDLQKTAPYPRSSAGDYAYAVELYQTYNRFVTWIDGTHSPGKPLIVRVDKSRLAKLIENDRQAADEAFTAYIDKLTNKVGDITACTLTGGYVWDGSILTVTQADGWVQRWKTQIIVNYSSLGKWFHQWPTRKIKG